MTETQQAKRLRAFTSRLPFEQVQPRFIGGTVKDRTPQRREASNRMIRVDSFTKRMGRIREVWTGEQLVSFEGKTLTFSTPEEMEEILSSL